MRPITRVSKPSMELRTPSNVLWSPLPSIIKPTPTKSAHIATIGERVADSETFSVEIPICEDLPVSIDKNVLGTPATTGQIPNGPISYEVVMGVDAILPALDVAQFTDFTTLACTSGSQCGEAPIVRITDCSVLTGTATCPTSNSSMH